jgi:hypothetical protein
VPATGDFNGDGPEDIVTFTREWRGRATIYVALAMRYNTRDTEYALQFTQLKPEQYTRLLRRWTGTRTTGMVNCEWIMGVRQYSVRRATPLLSRTTATARPAT